MPVESSRKKYVIIGHIVENDGRVRHHVKPAEPNDGPAAGAEGVVIMTSKLDTLKTDTIVEVVTSWSVVV